MEKGLQIKILVAESVDLIRMGLRSLFQKQPSICLVAETNTLENLSVLMAHHKPDIALIDLALSDVKNYKKIEQLLDNNPDSTLLFLTQHNDDIMLQKLHQSGAAGVIFKYYSCKLLLKAIHTIYSGQSWFDSQANFIEHLDSNNFLSESPAAHIASTRLTLSPRERHIAHLACKGLSAKEIGNQLLLTEKTIRNQLSLIYQKIGVKKKMNCA